MLTQTHNDANLKASMKLTWLPAAENSPNPNSKKAATLSATRKTTVKAAVSPPDVVGTSRRKHGGTVGRVPRCHPPTNSEFTDLSAE